MLKPPREDEGRRERKERRTASETLGTDTEDSVDPVSEGCLLFCNTNLLLADYEAVSEVDLVHPCNNGRI